MNDVDEDNNTKVYGLDTKKGAQTYKFADLAELVVEKDTDDFDDDLDESNSDDDYLSEGGESTGQLPETDAQGLRISRQQKNVDRQEELNRRMSVGSYAPGIKVRNFEELTQEIQQKDIVSFEKEIADPIIYSMQGGLFKFLKDRINTFMRNEPEFNMLLASILVKLSSFPVKIDILDG